MEISPAAAQVVRFGTFEVDLRSGELRKKGVRVKLQEQPFQIMVMLLERPGEVVTREELRQKLWPEGTFVDFEHGLNAAINRLRDALDDTADNPRFVETVPRRGYRFIAPVEGREVPAAPARAYFRPLWIAGLAGAALVAVLIGSNVGGLRDKLAGKPVPGEITSIAVLALENLSGNPEQEYFADGMTEALITEFGKISALRVISRQSVMQYKRTDKPLPEIARELNVDGIVEGAVVREEDRVRITVQLIQAAPERHLWAESYERDLIDILVLQREVAQAIAREIEIAVTPEEETRLATAHPINPEAYEAYLKGRYFRSTGTSDGYRKAVEYFQQAIEIDPEYALAYAGLAHTYVFLDFASAKLEAMKALEIDDTVAEAHSSLARALWHGEWDWMGAERHFQQALQLDPGSVGIHGAYSHYLRVMGRHEEALAEAKRARELDPASPGRYVALGSAYYYHRQYDEAIEQHREALKLNADYYQAHPPLALAYLQKGMYREAIGEFQVALDLGGGDPDDLCMLGHAYALAGNRAKAEEILARVTMEYEQSRLEYAEFGVPFFVATIHAALGEKDQAFAWLEKAYEDHVWPMSYLKVDPLVDPLRDDPRFQDILRRMNFPE